MPFILCFVLLVLVGCAGDDVRRQASRGDAAVSAIVEADASAPVREEAASARIVVPGLEEPLVAASATTAQEDRDLDHALSVFDALGKAHLAGNAPSRDDRGVLAPLERFVATHEDSGWAAALRMNLGLAYAHRGYFGDALAAYEQAWKEGGGAASPDARATAERAFGELVRLRSRFGHADETERLLAQVDGRAVGGSASELVEAARSAVFTMRNLPEEAFRCGPTALSRVLAAQQAPADAVAAVQRTRPGPTEQRGRCSVLRKR